MNDQVDNDDNTVASRRTIGTVITAGAGYLADESVVGFDNVSVASSSIVPTASAAGNPSKSPTSSLPPTTISTKIRTKSTSTTNETTKTILEEEEGDEVPQQTEQQQQQQTEQEGEDQKSNNFAKQTDEIQFNPDFVESVTTTTADSASSKQNTSFGAPSVLESTKAPPTSTGNDDALTTKTDAVVTAETNASQETKELQTEKADTVQAGKFDDDNNNNNETTPTQATTASPTSRTGFVNHGLEHWERNRQRWLGLTSSTGASGSHHPHGTLRGAAGGMAIHQSDSSSSARPVAVPLDVDEIIDVIFASSASTTTTPRKFPQAVPLPQMVDVLQDLWEAEGLDV